MGVAEYRVSQALPELLRNELPSQSEFAREFPLMSLVKLRIEIEREVRERLGPDAVKAPLSLGQALWNLAFQGEAPAGSDAFHNALQIMNKAAHGIEVPQAEADEAIAVAARFLADLKAN